MRISRLANKLIEVLAAFQTRRRPDRKHSCHPRPQLKPMKSRRHVRNSCHCCTRITARQCRRLGCLFWKPCCLQPAWKTTPGRLQSWGLIKKSLRLLQQRLTEFPAVGHAILSISITIHTATPTRSRCIDQSCFIADYSANFRMIIGTIYPRFKMFWVAQEATLKQLIFHHRLY